MHISAKVPIPANPEPGGARVDRLPDGPRAPLHAGHDRAAATAAHLLRLLPPPAAASAATSRAGERADHRRRLGRVGWPQERGEDGGRLRAHAAPGAALPAAELQPLDPRGLMLARIWRQAGHGVARRRSR